MFQKHQLYHEKKHFEGITPCNIAHIWYLWKLNMFNEIRSVKGFDNHHLKGRSIKINSPFPLSSQSNPKIKWGTSKSNEEWTFFILIPSHPFLLDSIPIQMRGGFSSLPSFLFLFNFPSFPFPPLPFPPLPFYYLPFLHS